MDDLFMKIRTIIFYFFWSILTISWSFVMIFLIFIPSRHRYPIASRWADMTLWLCRVICGVKWELHGQENLLSEPVVLISNHQSTLETLFLPILVRHQVWVMKRELLWIPFFGWGLAVMRPIAINRNRRKKAMQQVIEQGSKRVQEGLSVIIFPEGHRHKPDAPIVFKLGAARLASSLNVPILPVAHNAGLLWPRGGWIRAGTVDVHVGKSISPEGMSVDEINAQAEKWVSNKRDELLK